MIWNGLKYIEMNWNCFLKMSKTVYTLFILYSLTIVYTLKHTKKFKKSDLTLIEINVMCEVPFYFTNKIIIDKIVLLGTTMTLTSRHEFDICLKS